jgi:hypothetical protein
MGGMEGGPVLRMRSEEDVSGFQGLSAVTVSSIIIRDVTPCFGEKYCLHLQGKKISQEE